MGHELFVILFAALIGSKRWASIADLLADPIYVEQSFHGEPATLHFSAVSKYVGLLETRKLRTGSNQISLHADILNARHSEGSMAAVMPVNEFQDADYFLFLRSVVEVESESLWQTWLAFSALYMSTRAPRFLMEAERIARAQEIATALGVGEIAIMCERIQARGSMIRNLFPHAFMLDPVRRVDFGRIGVRA